MNVSTKTTKFSLLSTLLFCSLCFITQQSRGMHCAVAALQRQLLPSVSPYAQSRLRVACGWGLAVLLTSHTSLPACRLQGALQQSQGSSQDWGSLAAGPLHLATPEIVYLACSRQRPGSQCPHPQTVGGWLVVAAASPDAEAQALNLQHRR
uniref:Putative secreted protein n=1 Tax=Amblyomma americanum TaxID=6943 RepID=A0A0C9RX65_AMBAM